MCEEGGAYAHRATATAELCVSLFFSENVMVNIKNSVTNIFCFILPSADHSFLNIRLPKPTVARNTCSAELFTKMVLLFTGGATPVRKMILISANGEFTAPTIQL
jgi:hypothetical protein